MKSFTRRQLVVSGVTILLFTAAFLSTSLLYFWEERTPDSRTRCRNNLKQLGFALHNYHDAYGTFPPAYVADAEGNPIHSWRVLLLPFLDMQHVYDAYQFDEPWNSEQNKKLLEQIPDGLFHCESAKDDSTLASYVVVVGENTAWTGEKPVGLENIHAGPQNTILLVEYSGDDIVWTEPRDLDYSSMPLVINPAKGAGISSTHHVGAHVLMSDGLVRYLENSTDPEQLRRMLERDDGTLGSQPQSGDSM